MSDNLSLDVLIAELETAPKGSAELSEAVARAFGWRIEQEEIHDVWVSPESYRFRDLPRLTEDLGAATYWLKPEEAGFTLHRFLGLKGRSWATVFTSHPKGTPHPVGTLARP